MVSQFRTIFTKEGDLFILHLSEVAGRAFGYLVWQGELCGEVFAESTDGFTQSMSVRYLNASDSEGANKCGHYITQVIDEQLNCHRSVVTASAKLFKNIGGLSFGGRLSLAILKPVLCGE